MFQVTLSFQPQSCEGLTAYELGQRIGWPAPTVRLTVDTCKQTITPELAASWPGDPFRNRATIHYRIPVQRLEQKHVDHTKASWAVRRNSCLVMLKESLRANDLLALVDGLTPDEEF